jgi:hypothetical protein
MVMAFRLQSRLTLMGLAFGVAAAVAVLRRHLE